jgi:hypothetical protein
MLKESLGNSSEVDFLEPFIRLHATFDDLTHFSLARRRTGMAPLHGALHMCSVRFVRCVSIKELLLLPCPSKVQGNLWCQAINKALHSALRRWSKLRMLRLLRTLSHLHIHEILTQGSLRIIDKQRDPRLLKGDQSLSKEILAQRVLHLPTMNKLVKRWYNRGHIRS